MGDDSPPNAGLAGASSFCFGEIPPEQVQRLEWAKFFEGYTIPTCVRVGWQPSTEKFESEREFFRAAVRRCCLQPA